MRTRSRMDTVCWIALIVALTATAGAQAQEPWSWPEKAENLQQLPKDFPGQRLRAVMTGFSRALGVRCSHCHVGEEGQPLSTYDFAADDNPNKQTARQMLAMLGMIGDELKKVEPSGAKRVNMWCHTCHAGRPRPMTLTEELTEVYTADGLDATIAHFRDLRERYYGKGAYDFSETALNRMGYRLLGDEKYDEAIAIFKLNAKQFPESGNVWDSLAEGYMKAGDNKQAIAYYQKSLELDPDNKNAVEKLRELKP